MISAMEEKVSILDQDTSYGKMSPEHSRPTEGMISAQSLKKSAASQTQKFLYLDLRTENGRTPDVSWEKGQTALTRFAGGYSMPNISEFPKDAVESHLWQVLETEVPPIYSLRKWYLSIKACLGILGRAERREKHLERKCPILYKALLRQSASKNEPDAQGGARES